MNTKTITKVLATILAFLLSFANVALLGSYAGKTYAAETNLEEQTSKVDKAEIEFDAYFEEEGEKAHSKKIDVDSENNELYLELTVEEGYLKDAVIKIENANFKVQETNEAFDRIQSISSDENKIVLNQINKDESVVLKVPVKINADSSFDVGDLSKIADIKLEGTYVNNNGKEISVEKTIKNQVWIDGEAESSLEGNVEKYVTFNANGNRGVILQTSIKSKLVDNKLPIKTTKLEIEIPVINNIMPKAITLSSKTLMASKGTSGKVFTEDEYVNQNGKIILEIENDGEILSWAKNAEDDIILTCIYGENAIADVANINLKAKSHITYYGEKLKEVEKEIDIPLELTTQIGGIITLETALSETTLYKGYMLERAGKNTSFEDTLSINIGYSDLVDKITFKDETSYVDGNGNMYPSNALYTYTKIDKENLVQILGEDGYINVYSKDGKILSTLNKENLEYKYEDGTSGVIFETSKPSVEGILKIENGREINALEYSREQTEMFSAFRVNMIANVNQNGTNIINATDAKDIGLMNPKTNAEIKISNPNISTVVKNEGVELRVVLKTNDASSALYKNPEIEITMPKYVTNIDIENVKLVYEKELKISDAKMYRNENGNIVIKIVCQGEQTSFNEEAIAEGATLLMNASIKADELTPTKIEKIKLNVKNAKTDESIEKEADLKFVAPVGIAMVSQFSNFNDEGKTVRSISGKSEVGEIKIKAPAKTADVGITLINNYPYNTQNVVILGRTPFEGNKKITSGEDLGSTFTAKMVSGIQNETGLPSNQITVYYSANGEATRELQNSENGWTNNPSNLNEIKSYMIVLNGYKFKTGDTLSFKYTVEIPEMLERNENAFGTFAVYYEREIEEEIETFTARSSNMGMQEGAKVGITTGEGPNLSVELNADVENNADVAERKNVNYTAKIKNNSNLVANGVVLKVNLPTNAYFVANNGELVSAGNPENAKVEVGSIAVGETKTVNFTLRMASYKNETFDSSNVTTEYFDENGNPISKEEFENNKFNPNLTRDDFTSQERYEEYLKEVEHYNEAHKDTEEIELNKVAVKVSVQTAGYDDVFESNERVNKIVAASNDIEINLSASTMTGNNIPAGTSKEYTVEISKNTISEVDNVIITCRLPDEIEFESATMDGEYNASTRTVTWKFDKLARAESLVLNVKTGTLPEGTYEKSVDIVFNATCSGSTKTFTSNTMKLTTVRDGYSISQSSNISSGKIKAGDTVRFSVNVKNLGKTSREVTIKDYLPKELKFVEYYYTQNGETYTRTKNSGEIVDVKLKLSPNEAVTTYIVAKADEKFEGSKEIENKVRLQIDSENSIEANKLSLTLTGKNGGGSGNGNEGEGKPGDKDTYIISGTAWLDSNKDGKRDENEELLGDIRVYLLNASNNSVVSKTATNKNGIYTFDKIPEGRYIVAFDYNRTKYELTKLQVNGVDESVNSDVLNMTLTLEGTKKDFGVTNTIALKSNLYNIDMGLIDSPKFDLELTKGVNLIQISNGQGTKSYKFDNTDLAKVEIPEKYMKGTVAAITYTFKVTNTGGVAGYANKIVDYKAQELSFNSALNPEWYQDVDGNLYTTALSGKEIAPGETVEVSLILTKTMTNENTGISNNSAEIAEASNDRGLADIDSTPGNKNTSEDDYGSADVIITLKTGGILFYAGIVLAVLGIFALGAYEINKRVLMKI